MVLKNGRRSEMALATHCDCKGPFEINSKTHFISDQNRNNSVKPELVTDLPSIKKTLLRKDAGFLFDI